MTGQAVQDAGQPEAALGSPNPFKRLAELQRRGPGSLINLSFYAFGLSGLWTAMGTPILPIKVDEILDDGSVTFLTFSLDRNGLLGLVSLVGLAVAAIAQVAAGVISDRGGGVSRRLPFILLGATGMAASVLFLGTVGSVVALITVIVLVQVFGNLGQGPANALIADHVSPGKKGRAAGALNLSRVAGAGLVTAIVLGLMSRYDRENAAYWLWISLGLMAVVAIGATLWTVISLRRQPAREPQFHDAPVEAMAPLAPAGASDDDDDGRTDRTYLRFLVAMSFVISAMSALQIYSFYYLEDVIGLENPAEAGIPVLLAIGAATALTVLPAGRLADTVGRNRMLYVGAGLGVIACVVLALARSLIVVVIDGVLVGIAIGIFLTVSWTVANDLVRQRHAARDLGYASIAVFIGSAVARLAGIGVDRLNDIHFALGYQVVLGAVAAAFIVSVAMMSRLYRQQPSLDKPRTQAAG